MAKKKKQYVSKTGHRHVEITTKPAKDGNIYRSFIENGERYMICQNSIPGGKYWKGQLCSNYSNVGNDVVASLCWKCSYLLAPFEETVKKSNQPSKGPQKPAGWHFMAEFVDSEGNVYHKGVEQPDLKGTLPATKVDKKKPSKPKLTKAQKLRKRQELLSKFDSIKKELQVETRKTYKAKLKSQLSKIERELKKV